MKKSSIIAYATEAEERDMKFEELLSCERPLKFHGILTIKDVVEKLYPFTKDVADNQRVNKEKPNSKNTKNWVMDVLYELIDSIYSSETQIPKKLLTSFKQVGLDVYALKTGYIQPMGLWFQPIIDKKGNIDDIKIFIEDGLHRKIYITSFLTCLTEITAKDINKLDDLEKREKLLKLCKICGGIIRYDTLPTKLLKAFNNMEFVVNVCFTTEEEEGAKMFAYMNAGVPVSQYDRLNNIYSATHAWKLVKNLTGAFAKDGTKFFVGGKEFTQSQASNIAFLMPVQTPTKTFKLLRDILAVGNYQGYEDGCNWEDPMSQNEMFVNLFERYRNNDEAFDEDLIKTLECLSFIGSIAKKNKTYKKEGHIKTRLSITTGMIFAMMRNKSVNIRNSKKVQAAFNKTVKDFEGGKVTILKKGNPAVVGLEHFSNSHYVKKVPMLFADTFLKNFEEVV